MSRELSDLERAAWEKALALWGVSMHDPRMRPGEGEKHGGAPAWFTFPASVTVDPAAVATYGGTDELDSVFAHELGHHVLAPSTRIDALKIRHQLGRTLQAAGLAHVSDGQVALLSNLWTDLLVNTRVALLQRAEGSGDAEPGIVRMCRALYAPSIGGEDRLWWVYCRTYELLWHLVPGTLCAPQPPAAVAPAVRVSQDADARDLSQTLERFREKERALREARSKAAQIEAELATVITTAPETDAALLADAVRTFASDPVGGALRFGVVTAPYIAERDRAERSGRRVPAVASAGECADDTRPASAQEIGRILADRRMDEPLPQHPGISMGETDDESADGRSRGQRLGVAETLGLYPATDADTVLTEWYRMQAAAWVRPVTRARPPQAEELPGPLETWETGDDLAVIDWAATLRSGPVVPGVTTKRRSQLVDETEPVPQGLDVDVYIDSSGSMPRPDRGSPAVLAAVVLALSVLRGGGRVRVTSFSGPGQVAGIPDYSRRIDEIIRAILTFFSGGTTFPIDLYAQRHLTARPAPGARQRHVVVLSDDGLTSLFGAGNPDAEGIAAAVRATLTTATLVLMDRWHQVADLAAQAGYDVIYLETMDDAPRACAQLARTLHG
ncbi:VWA domain-containing protein [Microbacterium sp. KR10-403]|uniref:VWA domain-containing protein n=1 Tax=Microbacterium sp. KR10-403 TaxID=3158581 RepID=UPI0032E45117